MKKLNNDQLRTLYFEPLASSTSFRNRKDHIKANRSKQSFFDPNINYKRFSEEEINCFEKFFNIHTYPTPQNYTLENKKITPTSSEVVEAKTSYFTATYPEPNSHLGFKEKEVDVLEMSVKKENPSLSQLEKDLLEQDKVYDQLQETPQTSLTHATDDLEIIQTEQDISIQSKEANVSTDMDDDLIYLNTLVENDASAIVTSSSNSLSDLFAEIVDNEKASISNYEPSVFDANVQMLFDDHSEIEPAVSSVSELEIPTFNIELPPVPEPPKMMNESTVSSVIDSEKIETPEVVAQKFVEANLEELIPEQWKTKKNAKLRILDTILVLIIFIVIVIFAINHRHLLPFDLPF